MIRDAAPLKRTSDPTIDHSKASSPNRSRINPPPSDGRNRTGPYSRWLTRGGNYSGKSREGRFLNACRRELEQHFGGNLTAAQKILVERICFLRLRAALFDEQFLEKGRPLGELDYRVYMAISNALVRASRELGLKASRPSGSSGSLSSVMAELGDDQAA